MFVFGSWEKKCQSWGRIRGRFTLEIEKEKSKNMRGRTKRCDYAEDEDSVVKCGAHNFSSCEKKCGEDGKDIRNLCWTLQECGKNAKFVDKCGKKQENADRNIWAPLFNSVRDQSRAVLGSKQRVTYDGHFLDSGSEQWASPWRTKLRSINRLPPTPYLGSLGFRSHS